MSAESGLDFMPGSEVIADSKPQQSVGSTWFMCRDTNDVNISFRTRNLERAYFQMLYFWMPRSQKQRLR